VYDFATTNKNGTTALKVSDWLSREDVARFTAKSDLHAPDPRLNTRTVDAPWWQRLLFVPNGVNYHMEHHFMASVPCYRLPALREHLRRAGALEGVPVFKGYGEVIRHVIAPKQTAQ
jgi:fatty acid desaturase